jgi:nicotinamidase-related amidase
MLNADNTLLLIIDMQGNMAQGMADRAPLFENIVRLIRGIRIFDIPIVITEHLPEKLGTTVPEIAGLLPGVSALPKETFSCCADEHFSRILTAHNRRQILVAGIEAHICVYQTAADLIRAGYETHLVADAVSSRTPRNREIGIGRLRDEGAKLASTEMVLFELLKEAGAPGAREIFGIVR